MTGPRSHSWSTAWSEFTRVETHLHLQNQEVQSGPTQCRYTAFLSNHRAPNRAQVVPALIHQVLLKHTYKGDCANNSFATHEEDSFPRNWIHYRISKQTLLLRSHSAVFLHVVVGFELCAFAFPSERCYSEALTTLGSKLEGWWKLPEKALGLKRKEKKRKRELRRAMLLFNRFLCSS